MKKCICLLIHCSIFISFLTIGCTKGPMYFPVSVQHNEAIIYIYRENAPLAHAFMDNIFLNGVMLGPLPAGGYYVCHVPPGQIELSRQMKYTGLFAVEWVLDQGESEKPVLTFTAEPSKQYYVEWTCSAPIAGGSVSRHLALKSKKEIINHIIECRLIKEITIKP